MSMSAKAFQASSDWPGGLDTMSEPRAILEFKFMWDYYSKIAIRQKGFV